LRHSLKRLKGAYIFSGRDQEIHVVVGWLSGLERNALKKYLGCETKRKKTATIYHLKLEMNCIIAQDDSPVASTAFAASLKNSKHDMAKQVFALIKVNNYRENGEKTMAEIHPDGYGCFSEIVKVFRRSF
jgi:hypothetical protein